MAVSVTLRGTATLSGVVSRNVTLSLTAVTGGTSARSSTVTLNKTGTRQRAATTTLTQGATSRRASGATPQELPTRRATTTQLNAKASNRRSSTTAPNDTSGATNTFTRRSTLTTVTSSAFNIRGTATYSGVVSKDVVESLLFGGLTATATALRSSMALLSGRAIIRVYIDGSQTPSAIGQVNAAGAFSFPVYSLLPGTHTVEVTAQYPGSAESVRSTPQTVIITNEEESDLMPAHTINESTVPVTQAATKIDPAPPAAKRYMVRVVNLDSADRVWVGFSNAVTASSGQCIEADFGQQDFFIDVNVPLYAITTAGNTANVRVYEYVTL